MSTQVLDRTHPVTDLARGLTARLQDLADVPMWSMTPAEQRQALRDLARAETQLAALRLRVLAEADRSGATATQGAATVADWLAVETRQVHRHVRADLTLARRLEDHRLLDDAFASGALNTAQARAIVTALDRLPVTGHFAVTDAQRAKAEAHLVALAEHHDAHDLTVLGRKLFEVVAPDLAEEFEGKVLAGQEAAALRRTTLSMREDDEGTCHGRFRIPVLHGQILHKFLLALTSPERPVVDGERSLEPDPPAEVRRGLAFCQLLEAVPATALPTTGGASATVVVTMTLNQLRGDLHPAGACDLDTGAQITAAEARRLACTAGVIPAVLGGASQVLDLGRRRRFHSPSQRLAMTIRDRGCTAAGCDKPASMCHAHHDLPWSQGGPTDLDHGRLLCGHHHRRIHDPAYTHRLEPDHRVSFHRRE